MNRSLVWCVIVLVMGALVVGFAGCGDGGGVTTCSGALDCPGTQVCVGGACKASVVTTGEVSKEASGEVSKEASGEVLTDSTAPEVTKEPVQETSLDAGPTEGGETTLPEEAPICEDQDKDGYCKNIPGDRGVIDCDDTSDKIYPTAKEICNGLDDNCDGKIDEDLTPPPCTLDKGVCKGALQICEGKSGWKDCNKDDYNKHAQEAYQEKETSCDGQDNDCDGQTDESYDEAGKDCTDASKKGECARGKYECSNGKLVCIATTKAGVETCNNGKDEDCDGQTDENPPCSCKAGATEACFTGTQGCTKYGSSYKCTSPCASGKRTCNSNSQWGACIAEVVPTAELCDGKDNDCNGKIDETFTALGRTCISGKGACIRKGVIVCDRDPKLTRCNAVPGKPTTEVCDGVDNDCDGFVDEKLKTFTFYQDLDNDKYGNPRVTKVACQAPKGYVSKSGDCYDKNPNAKPGQTNYYSTHRGDGSFDYNCDNRAYRRPLTCSSCTGYVWASSRITCGVDAPVNRCKLTISCKTLFYRNTMTTCR